MNMGERRGDIGMAAREGRSCQGSSREKATREETTLRLSPEADSPTFVKKGQATMGPTI
jgi:hypothetical protein